MGKQIAVREETPEWLTALLSGFRTSPSDTTSKGRKTLAKGFSMRIPSASQLLIVKAATVVLLASGLTVAAFEQTEGPKPPAPHQKTFGYQDAKTGVFHPMLKIEPHVTTAPTTGTIELTITITPKTLVSTCGSVYCTTELDASSESETTFTGVDYLETSFSVAKVTGSTATCTITTPYSWIIPKASTTQTNTLSAVYTVGIFPPTTTLSVVEEEDYRTSTGPFSKPAEDNNSGFPRSSPKSARAYLPASNPGKNPIAGNSAPRLSRFGSF